MDFKIDKKYKIRMNIKLSICIPTYNRAKFLNEAIESVVTQITEDITDKVELCISDNTSTDNTEEIVEKWKKQSPISIVYHKNEENLGADKNFLKVIKIANGEYCWYLGSDDKIINEGIKIILSQIEGSDIDIFLSNRIEFNNDFSKKIGTSDWFKLHHDKIFDFSVVEVSEYLKYGKALGAIFSYISSVVFKRISWNAISNKERYVGTLYSHTYILAKIIKNKVKLKYIDTPLSLCRLNDDEQTFAKQLGNYKRLYVDYYNLLIFNDVFGMDSKEAYFVKKILSKQRNVKSLLALRLLLDNKDYENLLLLLNNLGFFREYFLLKYLPTNMIKTIKWIYKKL